MSDAYLNALYPPETNHLESIDALLRPNVVFLGIEEAGELVACAAVKLLHDDVAYGEIKRLFVSPACRGRGHARSLLQSLEAHVRAQGIGCMRLEAGYLQAEALGLYRALGYRDCEQFGSYVRDYTSVFMEKLLESHP